MTDKTIPEIYVLILLRAKVILKQSFPEFLHRHNPFHVHHLEDLAFYDPI
jgi:hypothetical protein